MNRKEIWDILETKILPLVRKPARYTGGEINSVYKDLKDVKARIALVFPDLYEIGMSNLGLKILYEEINSKEGLYAERVFSPWIDMEKFMRLYKVPVFSLETHSPLTDFDIIGFSLQHELSYTNALNILDLAGIPMRAEERLDGEGPLIIAGGLAAYTPEPMAHFIDLFIVGDGEEAVVKILESYNGFSKREFLQKIRDSMDCVYVPLYPGRVRKNVIKGLRHPVKPIIPLIEVIHDRVTVEIMRGCPRSCRFCQAGILYRPVRKSQIPEILDCASRSIENTGFNEIGLLSLSSTDFGGINKLADTLLKKWGDRKVSISLPSMRIDSFSLELIDRISRAKKTGITLAPEAGSPRLLELINKGYKPEDVITVSEKAYTLGYRTIKLYYMIGLPGEDKSDLDSLIDVLHKIGRIGFNKVNVSISTMIPKPHTPFQWMGMSGIEEIRKRQDYIKRNIKRHNIKLDFHNPRISILETVLGRGDRRLGEVIYKAWQMGARFDQWQECFSFNLWEEAFRESGVRIEDYLREFNYNEPLPWDHIDVGLSKEFFLRECEQAVKVLNCK